VIPVPPVDRDLIPVARLSQKVFEPSDIDPAVLTVVAGRVDGTIDRPQLLPLDQLTLDLYRAKKRLGRLALIRDMLPGRYAFGITGRAANGARLRPGAYELRLTATPVGGGPVDEQSVPFVIR
jgi:hypothetical protein